MIEMAVAMAFLVPFTFLVLGFCATMREQLQMVGAAREGARLASSLAETVPNNHGAFVRTQAIAMTQLTLNTSGLNANDFQIVADGVTLPSAGGGIQALRVVVRRLNPPVWTEWFVGEASSIFIPEVPFVVADI